MTFTVIVGGKVWLFHSVKLVSDMNEKQAYDVPLCCYHQFKTRQPVFNEN